MQLIVHHVGTGRVVGDHGQAVGLVGAGGFADGGPVHEVGAGGGLRIDGGRDVLHLNGFGGAGDGEGEMRLSVAPRGDHQPLIFGGETLGFHAHAVFAKGYILEPEFAGFVADRGLGPLRTDRSKRSFAVLHRTVLGIVDQSVNRAENVGVGGDRQ